MTVAEEITKNHIDRCNDILCEGHKIADMNEIPYKIGDLVTTLHAYPRNIIGIVCGYIFSPFTNSYRVVLSVGNDIDPNNIRASNEVETTTFNYYTDNFEPVETRYTLFFK